jgi:hypothetical protein
MTWLSSVSLLKRTAMFAASLASLNASAQALEGGSNEPTSYTVESRWTTDMIFHVENDGTVRDVATGMVVTKEQALD